MEKITVNGVDYRAGSWDMFGVKILLIKGTRGALGCGYINLAAAEKFGHALAVVSGVADYNEMLAAEVKAVSSAAAKLGITPGMTGKEALEKLA